MVSQTGLLLPASPRHPVGGGLLFLALLVVVGWWSARRHPEHEAAIIWTVLGSLAALGLSQALAQAVARPRPYQVLKGIEVLVPRVSGYGLPSGRAAVAGAVVCGLLLAGRWRLALVASLGGLLLLFAGVYVGVDYPSAEAAGAVFGAAVVLVLWPLVAWLLSAMVNWVGTSPLGRVFAVRGALKRPVSQWPVERTSQRLPDAKAMDALRNAPEAARSPGYKQGGTHRHSGQSVEVAARRAVPGWGTRLSPGYGVLPLHFAQAAPNPVRLTDPERVTEAFLAHRASGADGLGLPLSRCSRFFALEVRRREKSRRRLAATGGSRLPALRCVKRCHSVSSMPKVLLSRELLTNRECSPTGSKVHLGTPCEEQFPGNLRCHVTALLEELDWVL